MTDAAQIGVIGMAGVGQNLARNRPRPGDENDAWS